MPNVNMHEAKSKLSALVAAVESGREAEVVLMRGGKPAARIVPYVGHKGIIFGLAKGEFEMPSDEVWTAMDEDIQRMFGDALGHWNEKVPGAAA